MKLLPALLLVGTLATPLPTRADVVLSEFMASNSQTLADDFGNFEDWIEIYNAGETNVNLSGWSLTDAAGSPNQWQFPSTNLPPNTHLVVFASGRNKRTTGAVLHTNFKLSAEGEYLALVRPDGSIATQFAPVYPPQLANISYGLGMDLALTQVVGTNAVGRLHIPTSDALGETWTQPAFDASAWLAATNGIGYDLGSSELAPAVLRVLNSDPLGYWRLGEASGPAVNSGTLGTNANGSYGGTPTLAQAGPRPTIFKGFESNNCAPRFGPGTGYVTTGQPLANGRFAFTMSGWFNAQAMPGSRTALWGQNDVFQFGFLSATSLSLWTSGGGSLSASITITTNTWHHVAAAGDGSSIKLYLDGALRGTTNVNTLDYGSSEFPFNIGAGVWDASGNQFNGLIDEVTFYDRALSADELLLQYRVGLGELAGLDYLASLNPDGWWRLNETNGTTALNSGTLGAALNFPYTGGYTLGVAGVRPPTQGGFESNNPAARFNGSSGKVESSAFLPALSAPVFSVSAWARLTGGSGERVVVSSRDYGTPRGYVLAASATRWRFYIADTSGFRILEGPTLALNNWTHLLGTFDGTTARFYVNGVLSATTNVTQFQPNTNNRFRIGYGSYTGSSGYFPGDVDEVAYFQRALTGTEATNIFTSASSGSFVSTPTFYFTPFIRANVQPALLGVNSGAYWRVPFVVPNPAEISSLVLRARYDDGFVAYLNATAVEQANAPASVRWDAAALSSRTGSQAIQLSSFDLTSERGWLVPGTNWLAIHALNVSATDSDFLFQCELETTTVGSQFSPPRYFSTPTPGAANGTGTADLGPIISLVGSLPALPVQPTTNDSLTITAKILPAFTPVSTVWLNWRVMFNAVNQTQMFDDGGHGDGAAGDGVFGAVIPAGVAAPGEMIRWFITASDSADHTSRWPLFTDATEAEEYLGTVVADPAIQSSLPVLHTFIANSTAADTRTGTRFALFYNGEFYDNAAISLHGQSSANWTKKPYNFDFTREHRFKYLPGQPRQKDAKLLSNWGDKSKTHNALTHEMIARAGGGSHWCFQVRVQRNGAFWSIADLMEDADDNWLERLNRDPDGALYKIYDALVGTDSAEKKTRLYEDKSDLNSLITNLNETVPLAIRATYAYDNLDLPQVVSYFASLALVSSQDHGHKNYYVYRDSNRSEEWALLPWDTDLTWGRNWLDNPGYFTDTLYVDNSLNFYNALQQSKTANRLYDLIFTHPDFRNMYLRRLRTVMDTVLQPASTPLTNRIVETRIQAMMDLLDPLASSNSDADLDYTKWGTWGNGNEMRPEAQRIIDTYLPGRRAWLNSVAANLNGTAIPTAQLTNATLTFVAVEANPASGSQAEEFICLTNPSALWLDISGWQLEGAVRFTFKPGTVVPGNRAIYVSPDQKSFRARATEPRGGQNLYVTGPYSGQLSARGETLRLLNAAGTELTTFTYPGNPSLAQQYLRVTEIMYNPSPAPAITNDAQLFEYIELRNISTNVTLDLTGVCFTNGIQFNFTGSAVTSLAPGQRVLLVRSQAAFTARYGTGALIAGEFFGSLDSGGETLRLDDAVGEKILEFAYNNSWYPITDGLGFSLVIVDDLAPWNTWDSKSSWRASGALNGTPGAADGVLPAWPPIVINEVLTHTDLPMVDAIELYNPTTTNVNLGGWFLTDDFYAPKKYRIPAGTIISPASYLRFYADSSFGTGPGAFLFSEYGEAAFLFSGDAQTNLTGYSYGWDFGAAPNGVSFGRYWDSQGEDHFVLQSTNTLGQTNARPLVGPVVISEIMYHPPDCADGTDNGLDEYIELRNLTATNVPLFCTFTNEPGYGLAASTNTWRLRNAVDFDFPTNIVLPAGGRLIVVNFSPTNTAQLDTFRTRYNLSPSIPIFGPWSGQLDNSSETIELKRPDRPDLASGLIVPFILVDKVTYHDASPWAANADGLGLSLQRRVLGEFGNDAINWRAAFPPDAIAPDTDNDGMADWWERANGLVVGLNDANLDADADGLSNRQEFLAQTDPQNPASGLALRATPLTSNQFALSFNAVADVGYTIQTSETLSPSNWQPWQQVVPCPTNRAVTFIGNSLSPRTHLFRVVTPPIP